MRTLRTHPPAEPWTRGDAAAFSSVAAVPGHVARWRIGNAPWVVNGDDLKKKKKKPKFKDT